MSPSLRLIPPDILDPAFENLLCAGSMIREGERDLGLIVTNYSLLLFLMR